MVKNNKTQHSFTLIELMITISIIVIITSLTIPFYNQYTAEQQLKNEGKKIVDLLELTRKKSVNGDRSNYSCYSNTDFTGYQVTANNNQFRIDLCCGTSNTPCSNTNQITTYNLPSQISVSSSPNNNFRFTNLEGKTSLSTQITITIRQTAINRCVYINISPSGLINFDTNLTSC
jgi:prepilin-type N-terminal cleavage/methylation domain-containing protein